MRPARSATVADILPSFFSTPILPVVAAHEARAIMPAWLVMMAIASFGFLPRDYGTSFAVIAYTFGCSLIGSMVMGHDFTHRTLTTTLSQPIERAQLWRYRMLIAVTAMAPLMIISLMQHSAYSFLSVLSGRGWPLLVFLVPMLIGLCVAPWLTLVTRSALAGTVFSLCVPFLLSIASRLITAARYAHREEGFTPGYWDWFFVRGMNAAVIIATCAYGLFAARQRFLNLEVIERAGGISWSALKRKGARTEAVASRRGSAWWRMTMKEIRLFTLALVPAAGLLLTLLTWQFREDFGELAPILTVFWAALTCMLLGALSSAEERQLGTTEWQSVLPVAVWKQWLLKVTVVTALAGVYVVALPALAAHFGPWHYSLQEAFAMTARFAPAGAMLLVTSLYVSSLCQTSMQAILYSAAACAGVIWGMAKMFLFSLPPVRGIWRFEDVLNTVGIPGLAAIILLVPISALICFAAKNHFSAERGGGRALRQLGMTVALTIAAYITAAIAFGH